MTKTADGESSSGTLTSRAPIEPRAAQAKSGFRADVEGLRAVAIILIVGYHAGIPGFSGGFVGVDVFFVISGFLITQRLLGDTERAGAVPFAAFWSRRVRRLVPGLALMVVVTLLASMVIINPFDMLETAKEGAASAVYLSNIVFAQNTQNYFAPNPDKSPFLHTWSLGVEEQFYLVWPFLVLALLFVLRRRLPSLQKSALGLFTLIFAASLVLSVIWTDQGSAWAFFSLPTRAWEFAAGGFLGSVAWRRRALPGLLGYVGLALILVANGVFDGSTPYPGANALLPVAGAVLVILAGSSRGPTWVSAPSRGLGVRPMQWIGRLSYSWYLWHWPFIVLAVLAFNSNSTWLRTTAAIASLGAAYLAFHFVENPIRFSKWVGTTPLRAFGVGAVITVLTLGVAGGTWLASSVRTPTTINSLERAAASTFFPACDLKNAPGGVSFCTGGDLSSPVTLALVGDSHAAMWFNTFSAVGAMEHVRIVLVSSPGCPFIDVTVQRPPNGSPGPSRCDVGSGLAVLARFQPTAVVLAEHSGQYESTITRPNGATISGEAQVRLWQGAFRSFLTTQMAAGIRVGVILDNPQLPQEPAECVSQSGSLDACEPSRAVALSPGRILGAVEIHVIEQLGTVPFINPVNVLCNALGCPLVIHDKLLYIDDNHLSRAATQLLEPQVKQLVAALTGRSP